MTQPQFFEWDENKRQVNIEKHGVDFAKIAPIFNIEKHGKEGKPK